VDGGWWLVVGGWWLVVGGGGLAEGSVGCLVMLLLSQFAACSANYDMNV